MADDDDRETVASTKSGWPLDPERPRPSLPAFDRGDDRFAIGVELGRGGMGRVVEATDLALDRAVAIKLATSETPEDLLRFEREVRITARLEHPSIPPVHEAGRDAEGRPFYVMRKVTGDRLVDRIRAATTPRARLALVPNVLAAVDAAGFAHARGVIHRDIKPANILVGAYGETLLIDWGLARRLDEADAASAPIELEQAEPLTRAGSIFGTPGYMAPEQARGEPVDARADVYALGITLLHVLVGSIEPTVSISQVDAAVPNELIAIVGKATAERADDRYPDGGALANDLRAFLAGQLVAAHHYTARERVARFLRRHRVAVLVSAAALVGAIVIGVVSIVGLLRARDRAESARVIAEAERATTADRAEVMLLDRASTLAQHDPTRAVALLRQLPPTSPHVRRARDIAAMAASYGIARAASATPGKLSPIHHLALSPDGQWLATGALDGTIRLHRVETGATRILATLARGIGGVVWTDRGATLCVLAKDGLWRIALASGKATQLDPDAQSNGLWLGPADDRVRFIDDKRGVLVERSTREGEAPRILARDVAMAKGRGDITLVASPHRIAVLVGNRETVLVHDPQQLSPNGFAIAPGGLKIAAWSGGDVIEWSIDGRELQRYQTSRIAALQYGNDALYAMTDSELVTLANGRSTRLRENNQTIVWSDLTAIGPAFVGIDGTVVVIDALGVHVVPGEISMSRGIATSSQSTVVATGSLDGRVRWWDLAERSPRVYPGAEGEPCAIDRERFYMYSPGSGFTVVDRASGKIQRVENELLDNPFYCASSLARHIVLAMPPGSGSGRAVVIDLQTFAMTALDGITTIRGDRAMNTVVYSRGSTLVEKSPGSGAELVRWSAPEPIANFITSGRWLAAQAGTQLVRIDRATGARVAVTVVPGADLAGMTADGRMWWVQQRTLWWWDGHVQRAHHQFPAKPHSTTSFDDQLGLWLEDGSLWVANPQGVANRAPPGQRNVKFGYGTAAQSDAGASVIVRFLATGEQIIRRSRLSTVLYVADDGTLVVGAGTHAVVYQSSVPLDPAQLWSWLDRATNARLDPETGELTWR